MPFVRDNEPINVWLDGDFAQGFALLSRKEVRQDRNGRAYLDLQLTDATASIVGKVWPDNTSVRGDFVEGDFVAFKGTVKQFRDQLQLSVDHCRKARDPQDRDKGFDPANLIPTTPHGIEPLWARLKAIYPDGLEQPVLRALATIAIERHGNDLREHPAAKTIHHAYRGGLLEHTVMMAELAQTVCVQHPEVDRDAVLIGVLFHDLGKIMEIGAMPANTYTLTGHLVGHVVLGRDLLRACCDAVDGLSAELQMHLEHLVLSHQGRREYGSPVPPSTLEAFVLHFVDDFDSKLNQLIAARRSGTSMQFVRGLDRYVYLDPPPRTDQTEDESSSPPPEASS